MRYRLIAAAALASCSSAGGAAFPGGNGLIAFTRSPSAALSAIEAVDPGTGAVRQLAQGSAPAW